MSNQLQKFYNSFGGLDTRSNKLLQDVETCRDGSRNFRYNFQDELQNANGFQYKDLSSYHSQGLIEYKYTDLNTGQSKSDLLGVDDNGDLWIKRFHALKMLIGVPNISIPYSFFYNEKTDKFNMIISGNTIVVEETTTLDQLALAINNVAVGYAVDVVDYFGNIVVGSTQLAYLGNIVVNMNVFDNNLFQESWYFERVVNPVFAAQTEVLFPTTRDFKFDENYEGVSFVNINNSCYITDGGFPIKYDGKSAYRAGMPRTVGSLTGDRRSLFDGSQVTRLTTAGGALTLSASYRYRLQYGNVDANGVETLGAFVDDIAVLLVGTDNAATLQYAPIRNTDMFPVYACRVTANTILDNANQTFAVKAGHNLRPGMVLRIPITNGGVGLTGISFWYPEIITANPTSIVVENPMTAFGYRSFDNPAFTVITDQIINGGFTADYNKGVLTDPVAIGGSTIIPPVLAGAFLRVNRTTGNTTNYNKLVDLPVNRFDPTLSLALNLQTFIDVFGDAPLGTGLNLSQVAMNEEIGEELPRACKYLQTAQDLIIQGGRTPDASLALDPYPTAYFDNLVTAWGKPYPPETSIYAYNTEALLCDFQSIYWNDALNPEGFPQQGLNEFRISSPFNDKVTGFAPNKDGFVAFKERTTAILTGGFNDGTLQFEILEADVGCTSHRSIKEVSGNLIWLDGDDGFFSMTLGRLPVPIGYKISDYQKINVDRLDYRKAVAADLKTENLYFCSVGTTTFVFDYGNYGVNNRDCWYLWDRINVKNCIDTADNKYLVSDGTRLWQLKVTNTKYDFTDHKTAIPFEFVTAWANNAAPTIDKHQLGIWINSIQGDFKLDVDQYVNFLTPKIATYECLKFVKETDCKKAIKENVKAAIPKCVAVSYGFRNNDKNAFVRIQGFEYQYSSDYDGGEPKR